jgi:ABC-type antimicrobial peptide transport system permease subunit
MALGASQSHVRREVISRTLRLALSGIGIGLVASVALGRLIASLLFRTAPTDPLTFAGMVVLLGGVALLAGYLPARRASKINPTVALRTN